VLNWASSSLDLQGEEFSTIGKVLEYFSKFPTKLGEIL
jgi:hypothetical protein